MKKFAKLALVASVLSVVATSSFANGLKICSDTSVTAPITVACGPAGGPYKDTPWPIPAAGCTTELPWLGIRTFLNSPSGECVFSISGQQLGSANVSATFAQGTLSAINIIPPYSIDRNGYVDGTPANSITITVKKAA